ncbi:MAG: hypothetical protein WCI94_19565 [Rhodospirillales bacterium]
MAWRRLGLVYRPNGHHPHLATHAALPAGISLGSDLVRVFYSGRDDRNRSSIGSLVLRLSETPHVEEVAPEPALAPGTIGAFDDAGCGMGCAVGGPDGDRLYYMGWNVGGSVPWRNAIGLAIGDAQTGQFERLSAGPILDRDTVDPFSLSYPWVLRLAANDWRMWYGTHLTWGAAKSDMHHAIRAARSTDGIMWQRDRTIAVQAAAPDIAVVRPCVVAGPSGGEMWFAQRDDGPYRLGHALSVDLTTWQPDSDAILEPVGDSWEGGALTYASVIVACGRRWMLYNGSGYGAAGIGLAVWDGPFATNGGPGS